MRLVALAILTLVSACRATYAPNMSNVPLFKEQGEVRASIAERNLQAAVAVHEHVGVLVNGYYRSEVEDDGGDRAEGEGWLAEAGVGWFTTLDRPRWLQVEVYGGAGVGHVSHDITRSGEMTRHYDADAFKMFLQPSAGVTSEFIDAAVSLRMASVKYSNVEAENFMGSELEDAGFDGLEDEMWLFLEPSATVRIGYRWVKLQFQLGKSFKLNSAEMNNDSGMVTLGLNIDLFRAWQDTTKK